MKIVTATPKPNKVEAVQLDETVIMEVADWLNCTEFKVFTHWGRTVATFKLGVNVIRELEVYFGNWIVRDSNSPIRSMSDELFHEIYDNITEF